MNSEAVSALIIGLFGLTSIWFSFFYLTKNRFQNSKGFSGLKLGLPFSVSVNYWISKLFLLLSGFLFTVLGFYLFIRDM